MFLLHIAPAPRSQIRYEKEGVKIPKGNQIVLKPPSKEEANKLMTTDKKEEGSSSGSDGGKDSGI